MRSRIEPMKKVARTLRAHRELILNYFRARKEFSSGVIEGLNNKAKVTMRKSYGFRTFRVTERVWLFCDDGFPAVFRVQPSLFLGDVKGPVRIEVAAEIDGTKPDDGFGHGMGPAHA